MPSILQTLSRGWQRANLTQRILLLGIGLAFVVAIAVLVNWARQPDMSMLFSDLAPEEAAKIVDRISDADIKYELRSSGTAIYIPREHVHAMRLKMASQGLPTGDQEGYRILDEEKFGQSPQRTRVNYKRALEGEIAKSIRMLEAVASVRVQLALPEGNLFAKRKKESSATVVLTLGGGRQLTGANVAAIRHLVAGSVEGLSPSKVAVIDSEGNLLSGGGDDEIGAPARSMLASKRQHEQHLARKVEQQLSVSCCSTLPERWSSN